MKAVNTIIKIIQILLRTYKVVYFLKHKKMKELNLHLWVFVLLLLIIKFTLVFMLMLQDVSHFLLSTGQYVIVHLDPFILGFC